MKRLNLAVLSILAVLATVLIVGCAQTENTHTHEIQEVEVVATEFAFSPANITIETGRMVRLTLVNDGVIEHEWEIETPAGDVHIHALPGESSTIEFMLSDAGTYEMVCDLPGHLEAGMHGTFTVTGEKSGDDLIPHSKHEENEHADEEEHGH